MFYIGQKSMKLCYSGTLIYLNITGNKDIVKFRYENYIGSYICCSDYDPFVTYGFFIKRDKPFVYLALDKFL